MKKQINPTIKAHFIRGASYLLLFVAVCAIPFALAQRNPVAGKNSRTVFNRNSAHVSAFAPASAFRIPASALPKAKAGSRIVAKLLAHTPLFTYAIDDGTAEDSIGLTAGGTFVSCNSFPVTGGNNVITSISIAWGTPAFPDPTLNGLPYTAVLWSDPNGDGSPTDAVVLAQVPGIIAAAGTDTFITTPIPPTMVTTPNFFVGFLITHTAGQFPAAFDESAPIPNRSWIDLTSNINDLSGSAPIESFGLVGNWLIRADGNTGGPTPTGTPSPTATATCTVGYTTATGAGTITPGGTDTGNHCDDCNTDIVLPFPVNVYGAPVSVATVGSNGDLQLTASPSEKLFFVLDQCVPVNPDPASHGPFLNTLFPYYADMVTDESVGPCTGCGVFTQTLGTAPNRQFVIRWKTNYFNSPPGPAQAEFEVLLTEGSDTLSVIYGVTGDNGLMALSGIQQDLNVFTSFSCNEATLTPGLRVDYIPTTCGSPTPTATPTATATATATVTSTATATATATPTATMAPRATPSPRPRPTPAPRP